MAVANGYGKVATSGSVFMYDTGDTINSYLGEPTTNVFKHYGTTGQGSAADNNVNFEVNGDGIFIRLGYGQTFGGYTIQPNDVVYKYNLGGYGCHYHGNDVFVPSGTYVTFTFDYYISPGAGGYPETNYLANMETGTGAGTGIASPNNLTGVWQTISVTTGPTTSGGNLRPLLYPGACGGRLASSGYILFKNPQVEYKSHKTPFTQTSRSVTGSLLPLIGNSSIDLSNVSFDSNAQIVFDGTNDYVPITLSTSIGVYCLEMVWYNNNAIPNNDTVIGGPTTYQTPIEFNGNGSGVHLGAWTGGMTNEAIHIWGGGGATSNRVAAAVGYHHVVFNWNGTTYDIWVDGVNTTTYYQNGTTPAGLITATSIKLGRDVDNYCFNGQIPVTKIYNRTLSAAEVRQNYNKYKTRFNLP
jgi:hypothetical protein